MVRGELTAAGVRSAETQAQGIERLPRIVQTEIRNADGKPRSETSKRAAIGLRGQIQYVD